MGWSGITSVVTYSAGNAQALSVQAGEMVRVRTIRPSTGPDGEVAIYDQNGSVIKTITVSKSNPDNTVEFITSATSLNYSTTVAFSSPGLTIEFSGALSTPSYNPTTKATTFPGAVVASLVIAGRPWDISTDAVRLALTGIPTACVGSSTTEAFTYISRPTDIVQEASDGGFGCVQQKYGSPFTVVRGGFLGVGGATTGPLATTNTVLNQIQQALALDGAPTCLIYQPRGNDGITTAAVLAQSNYYIEQGIKIALKGGVTTIFLLKHYLTTPNVPYAALYEQSNAFIDSLEERYKGHVFVVDTYAKISPNSVPNTSLLDATGVHLNSAGCLIWAEAFEAPLQRAGIYPNCERPIDPDALPADNTVFTTNASFQGTTGAYSATGWAGVAEWSNISQGDSDPWGRKTARITQIPGNEGAFLRQEYTPSGTQCVARLVASIKPIQNCGAVGFIIRNASRSWAVSPMALKHGNTRTALKNGEWIHFISSPFLLDTAFFAAGSQFNVVIYPATGDSAPAIADVASPACVKIADSWS